MDIQKAFEMHEWGQESGQSPIVWAPYVRTIPLEGLYASSVVYQFANGDQQANNPDWTLHYRHDLAFLETRRFRRTRHRLHPS